MDYSQSVSSVHGVSQARILEWVLMLLTAPKDLPNLGIELASLVSPELADRFFTAGTTWEA